MSKFKRYKIKAGKHRSGIYFKPFLNKKSIKYEVVFTQSCIYEFNDIDQFDVNKLFGCSFGYNHHINSIRFGWRANGDKIEISAYIYKNKKREIINICNLNIDFIYVFELTILDNFFNFTIKDDLGKEIKVLNITKNKCPKWGYELFPYFGGNKIAPHDVDIFMKRL